MTIAFKFPICIQPSATSHVQALRGERIKRLQLCVEEELVCEHADVAYLYGPLVCGL